MSGPATTLSSANTQPTAERKLLLFARLLPECLSLVFALALALHALPPWFNFAPEPAIMQWVVMTEGATLMFLCTVVDIASRLRRAPPWWAGILLCAALLVLYPGVPQLVVAALHEGMWVALPFTWSILERLRELWTLPAQSRLEKQRRRALTFGRLYTGLIVAGTYVLTSFVEYLTIAPHGIQGGVVEGLAPWFLAVFFGLAAFDAWRVHQPAFAASPRNLWHRFDAGDTASLDPL